MAVSGKPVEEQIPNRVVFFVHGRLYQLEGVWETHDAMMELAKSLQRALVEMTPFPLPFGLSVRCLG